MSRNNSSEEEIIKTITQGRRGELKKEIFENCIMYTNKEGKKKLYNSFSNKITEWEYSIEREGNYFMVKGNPSSETRVSRLYSLDLKYKTSKFNTIIIEKARIICIDLYGDVTEYSLDLKTSKPVPIVKRQ